MNKNLLLRFSTIAFAGLGTYLICHKNQFTPALTEICFIIIGIAFVVL